MPPARYVFTYHHSGGAASKYLGPARYGEDQALSLIWSCLMQGWTLHPYNQNGNNEWVEWILTEDPLISTVGPAYRIVKVS